MNISDMFDSLNEQLDQLRPDPSSAVTPPLSPCWINASSESGQEDNTGDIWSNASNNKALGKVVSAHDNVQSILEEECNHLLRKAQSVLNKVKK